MKGLSALALVLLLLPAAALADGEENNLDLATELVERGEILPLANAMEQLLARYPGRIVEAEFELDDGLAIYELELLTEDGQLMDAEVDAATGAILEVEQDD